MTTKSTPGTTYLIASSHEATLRDVAARVLDSAPRRPLRIAATFAAAGGGPMADRTSHWLAALFGGATVRRFTVAGEAGGPGATSPPAQARAIVDDADLVFVSGGDPVAGANRLARAGADAWLREAHARGATCLGISAGAIMLAAWWAEWPDAPPHGAAHEGGALVQCAGVVPELVVDCHAEEDRWGELFLVRAMLRDHDAQLAGAGPARVAPPCRFLGLPTGGGIVVEADGTTVPIGVGGAPFELP